MMNFLISAIKRLRNSALQILKKINSQRRKRKKTSFNTTNNSTAAVTVEDMKADHGLVIMFQPLYDSHVQPIAVFASKETVKRTILAQLLIKSFYLL